MVPKQILSHLYKPNILVILNHVHRYCQRKPFVKRISFNIIFTCTYRKCFKKTLLNHNIGKNLLRFCKFLVYIINQISRYRLELMKTVSRQKIFIVCVERWYFSQRSVCLSSQSGHVWWCNRYCISLFFLVSLDLVSPLHCISTSININVPVSTLNMKTIDVKNEDRMFVCQITKFAILFSLLYFRW